MPDDDRETSSQFKERSRNERLLIYLSLSMAALCFAHQAIAIIMAWKGSPIPAAEAHPLSEVAQPTPGKVVLSQ